MESKHIFDREVLIILPHPLSVRTAMFYSLKTQTIMFLVLSFCVPPCLLLRVAARIWHAGRVCWCRGQLPFPAAGFLHQLLCIAVSQHGRRAARQTGIAKAGGILLSQRAVRECHAPEVPSKRDGGGNRGFYCLEASNPDLPSTSPNLEYHLHCYPRGSAGIMFLASWQPFRTVAH